MEGKSISEGGIVAAREIGYVTLTLSFEREGNKWVGTCLELGTSTFTRTLKQTQIDLKALVGEHLNLLEEEGERENFFKRWDIPIHSPKSKPHEFTIRASGDFWDRLFRDTMDPTGPFLRPSRFPVKQRRVPVGV